MSISEKIRDLKKQLENEDVQIVVVSKTHPEQAIVEAYHAGQRAFGENKVQELMAKYENLKHLDISWHLIGHLQTNKVKYLVPFVDLIHSVDSLKLLAEINKQSKKKNIETDCLLQFYIASEETKYGLDFDEATNIIKSDDYAQMKNVKVCGVMGMASFTEDMDIVRTEFKKLKQIFDNLKSDYFTDAPYFKEISMGMSGDWKIAVEEGSTLIRVGSIIFGERDYCFK